VVIVMLRLRWGGKGVSVGALWVVVCWGWVFGLIPIGFTPGGRGMRGICFSLPSASDKSTKSERKKEYNQSDRVIVIGFDDVLTYCGCEW